tara:strand:- start:5057 stop:5299 length:243 start_codon:yes stop_codon:yes gene_type:complete
MKRILIIFLITFSFNVEAGPKSSFDSFGTEMDLQSSRQSRTGKKSGWGSLNDNPADIDLSEWGGEVPTCDVAPECPICIK